MHAALYALLLLFFAINYSCSTQKHFTKTDSPMPSFEIFGHRGARGYITENTIPSFKKALDLGADHLEMDVIVTKDHKVVVSHEAWINEEISTAYNGIAITKENSKSFNLLEMDYVEVRSIVVGNKAHPRFPLQTPYESYKPLLSEVIDTMNAYAIEIGRKKPIIYMIELKSDLDKIGTFYLPADTATKLVVQILQEKKVSQQSIFQSFNLDALRTLKKVAPEVAISLLIDNKKSIETNIKTLGFQPEIYGPDYKLLNAKTIAYARSKDIKVIPWTVNSPKAIKEMVQLGVDGLISDYPDRAVEYRRQLND
jgi:glycerophosphoryl diester phosphodiesterase